MGTCSRSSPSSSTSARFERLLGEGRALLAEGEAERAAETLRTALALWRGPPLSDFASEPFAQGEIARLEELHLAALEERIEADLALGRHAELVSELEALVREHPLRERLRAQLMLALYRSGRQAEALAAYQQARRMLAEELGLEPGRRLQELEGAILRQDAELDPPGRAVTPLVRARRRSGLLIAIGAVLLLSAAIAVAGIELAGGDSRGLSSASANSVAAIDATVAIVSSPRFPVGSGPTSVAARRGSFWVTNASSTPFRGSIPATGRRRHDRGWREPERDRGRQRRRLGRELFGRHVSRIDPETNREADPVGDADRRRRRRGAVWVRARQNGTSRGSIPFAAAWSTDPTDALGRGIAVGGGSVWVTDESSRSVVRIDPRRGAS